MPTVEGLLYALGVKALDVFQTEGVLNVDTQQDTTTYRETACTDISNYLLAWDSLGKTLMVGIVIKLGILGTYLVNAQLMGGDRCQNQRPERKQPSVLLVLPSGDNFGSWASKK